MASHFGIDLVLETQKGNIRSENDVLIVLVHWFLCKNNFRNVGLGDNKVYSDQDRPSELLPQGWNQEQTSYTLRYTLNQTIYILYGIVSEDTLIINLLDAKTLKTASLVFKSKEVIKATTGATIDDYVKNSQSVIDKMSSEMVKPILGEESQKKSIASTSRSDDPLLIRPVVPPQYQDRSRDSLRDPLRDIGRGDLDPFGRGGGSLFNPDFRPEFGPLNPLGPGGVPPGARYDPPNPFRRLDPDNDHLRPPPGYDDMFM